MYPRLLQIGPVTIPTYGLFAAVGLLCAFTLAERNAKRGGVDSTQIWNLCWAMLLGGLIASRLVLALDNLKMFMRYPLIVLTLPTLTRFGAVFALLCGLAYARVKHMPLLRTADVLCAPAMLLSALLHTGDLMAGNDLGATTLSPLGRILPALRGAGAYNIFGTWPVAPVAALIALAIAILAYTMLTRTTQPGQTFGLTLLLAAGTRYLLNLFRPEDFGLRIAGVSLEQIVLLACVAASTLLLMDRKAAAHA